MDDRQRQTLQQNMIVLNVVNDESKFFRNALKDSRVICGLNTTLSVLT